MHGLWPVFIRSGAIQVVAGSAESRALRESVAAEDPRLLWSGPSCVWLCVFGSSIVCAGSFGTGCLVAVAVAWAAWRNAPCPGALTIERRVVAEVLAALRLVTAAIRNVLARAPANRM